MDEQLRAEQARLLRIAVLKAIPRYFEVVFIAIAINLMLRLDDEIAYWFTFPFAFVFANTLSRLIRSYIKE